MRSPVGVTLHRDGGHADDRGPRKTIFKVVVFRFALGQTKPPAIVMNNDRDMIGIVESLCTAFEGFVPEMPLR